MHWDVASKGQKPANSRFRAFRIGLPQEARAAGGPRSEEEKTGRFRREGYRGRAEKVKDSKRQVLIDSGNRRRG